MREPRYTEFQRQVMIAVRDHADATTIDVAIRVGRGERHVRRTLGLLAQRGQITHASHDRWHITTKGVRRLGDWGTGR